MRLSEGVLKSIKKVVGQSVTPENSSLYLFGSRVHDDLKGGDIDLLLIADNAVIKKLKQDRSFMIVQLQKKLGDRKIDLLICGAEEIESNVFLKGVFEEAVEIPFD